MQGSNRAGTKWAVYFLLLLAVCVLEYCVCNRLPLGNAIPRLLPLLACAMGFWEGVGPGVWLGLGAGFLSGLMTGSAGLVWLCPLLSAVCGSTRDKALGRTFVGYLLAACGCMLVLEGSELLWRGLFLNWNMAAMVPVALAEGGYSLLFTPVWYLCCRGINRRLPADLRV